MLQPRSQSDHAEQQEQLRQDPRRLLALFWSLARPFWRYAPNAKANFAWVVFLNILRSALSVVFSYISRDFWTALQKKDVPAFWRQIVIYAVVLLITLPILVWYNYAKERLSLRWRKWHTDKVLGDYFSQRNFYELDQTASVDNPDQRIADDIDSFTHTSLSLFMTILMSTIDMINFSVILFSIYPKLFLVLVGYSAVGTVIAVLIGRRLINLNFLRLQKEADFRYSLIRVRENAESIAFYNGEAREKFEVQRRLGSTISIIVDIITWSRNLSFFTTSYTYIIQILPLTIIAPLYFAGNIELGVVSQSQQAFGHILDDLSLIINQFERLSSFSAGVDRLGELEDFIYARFAEAEDRELEAHRKKDDALLPSADDDVDDTATFLGPDGQGQEETAFARAYGRIEGVQRFRKMRKNRSLNVEVEDDLLRTESGSGDVHISTIITPQKLSTITVTNLTLMTPDQSHRVLFDNLSFSLDEGKRLLIVGPSGSGKSSALRALAGLWQYGHGEIIRPKLQFIFFLPQRPYCTLGSLREQMVYPTPVTLSSASDDQLMGALKLVQLEELPDRMGGFDEVIDWAGVLSLGEQQRLAFARLIIGKPKVAILDECSSALDVASEDRLYSHLRDSGIAYISVGHRPTLIKYHDTILRFAGDGKSHSIEPITPQMQSS